MNRTIQYHWANLDIVFWWKKRDCVFTFDKSSGVESLPHDRRDVGGACASENIHFEGEVKSLLRSHRFNCFFMYCTKMSSKKRNMNNDFMIKFWESYIKLMRLTKNAVRYLLRICVAWCVFLRILYEDNYRYNVIYWVFNNIYLWEKLSSLENVNSDSLVDIQNPKSSSSQVKLLPLRFFCLHTLQTPRALCTLVAQGWGPDRWGVGGEEKKARVLRCGFKTRLLLIQIHFIRICQGRPLIR